MSENKPLPEVTRESPEQRAERYEPSPGLKAAVDVALDLGMPLLLTGEPGTGKTDLAHWVAHSRGLGRANVFHTKSNSIYTDLFYRYDALAHFRAGPDAKAASFIDLQPLGQAIQKAQLFETRSVVLVDEIDKAPRDLPNDILAEIEDMEFRIKETAEEFKADPTYQPVLIFTSNRERDLPDAFLRRCVFYYIDFEEIPLERIVTRKFKLESRPDEAELVKRALEHYMNIRTHGRLERVPATAELISWVDYLLRHKLDVKNPESKRLLAISYSLLAKTDEDLKKIKKI